MNNIDYCRFMIGHSLGRLETSIKKCTPYLVSQVPRSTSVMTHVTLESTKQVLRSTSVVTHVTLAAAELSYTTFDARAVDRLRLAPSFLRTGQVDPVLVVTAAGRTLPRVSASASQSHIIHQKGATSGFEMCFLAIFIGSLPKHVSNPDSVMKKGMSHLMYDCLFFSGLAAARRCWLGL